MWYNFDITECDVKEERMSEGYWERYRFEMVNSEGRRVIVTLKSHTKEDLLDCFSDFMLACGYRVDGILTFVDKCGNDVSSNIKKK